MTKKQGILQNLMQRIAGDHNRRKSPHRRRLALEPLESRQLLTTVSVSVGGTDDLICEDGETSNTFVFSRDDTDGDLSVVFTLNDHDATYGENENSEGADYYFEGGQCEYDFDSSSMEGTVHFEDGEDTAELTVTAIDDDWYEGHRDEMLTLTIEEDPSACDSGECGESGECGCGPTSYSVGTDSEATITIEDDDEKPELSITGSKNTMEDGFSGELELTMTGEFEGPMIVTYDLIDSLTGQSPDDLDLTSLTSNQGTTGLGMN